MASFNRVILMGNLTRDIELRHLPSGTALADVSLAVNDRRKTASGEWVDEVSFFDVTLWGRTAEVASQYLGKGSSMLVEGKLRQETWEKDGQKRSKVKVVCDRMQMIGGRSGSGGGGGGSVSNQESDNDAYREPASVGPPPAGPPADDIPF